MVCTGTGTQEHDPDPGSGPLLPESPGGATADYHRVCAFARWHKICRVVEESDPPRCARAPTCQTPILLDDLSVAPWNKRVVDRWNLFSSNHLHLQALLRLLLVIEWYPSSNHLWRVSSQGHNREGYHDLSVAPWNKRVVDRWNLFSSNHLHLFFL